MYTFCFKLSLLLTILIMLIDFDNGCTKLEAYFKPPTK